MMGVAEILRSGHVEVVGRLTGSSNATLQVHCDLDGAGVVAVYKPRRGERPLWDFATGTLGLREVATARLDQMLGWGLVPETVWREDGPYGPGSCQLWVEGDDSTPPVDVVSESLVPAGWLTIAQGEDPEGEPVVLAHEDSAALHRIAVLDVVANNADRKGGHVLRGSDGALAAIDHGLTFHEADKLRTVLWGWSGQGLSESITDDLMALRSRLDRDDHGLDDVLTRRELRALRHRVDELMVAGRMPEPAGAWPPLPWPAM